MNAKRILQGLLWAAAATTTVALAGCSRTEEEVKPDPSVTPDASDPKAHDSAALPTEWTCPQGVSGAKMVLIPWPDGSAYCIDEREAVYAEYKQFLDAKGDDFSGQPPECAWNDSFVPGWEDAAHEIPQCSVWLIGARAVIKSLRDRGEEHGAEYVVPMGIPTLPDQSLS